MRVLVGATEDAALKYAETLALPSADLDKLIKSVVSSMLLRILQQEINFFGTTQR